MNIEALFDWIVKIGATLAALGVIGAALRLAWRRAIDPTISKIAALYDLAVRELNPNGGESLKDEVRAIRVKQDDAALLHDADMADVWAGFKALGYDRRSE